MRADEYALNIKNKYDDGDGCDGIYIYVNIVTIDTTDMEGDFMSKSVQISVELFTELVKYHLLNVDNNVELIQKELHKKLERLNNREIYTNSKTAASQEERENSRKEYLERKGISESFRW